MVPRGSRSLYTRTQLWFVTISGPYGEWRPGDTYFICRPVIELLKQIVLSCQTPKDKNTSFQADWNPFPELLRGFSSSTKFPVRRHFMWEISMLLSQLQGDSSSNGRSNGTHLRPLFIHVYGAPAQLFGYEPLWDVCICGSALTYIVWLPAASLESL